MNLLKTVIIQKQWWTLLDDPVLNDLISRASVDNLDAKIALTRVEEARANFRDC